MTLSVHLLRKVMALGGARAGRHNSGMSAYHHNFNDNVPLVSLLVRTSRCPQFMDVKADRPDLLLSNINPSTFPFLGLLSVLGVAVSEIIACKSRLTKT